MPEAADCFSLVDQIVEVKLNGIEDLVVGNAANHNVIIRRIISGSAFQNKIEPFFGVAVKLQDFQFLVSRFVKGISGNNSISSTALKLFSPFYCLIVKRSCIKATSKIYICSGMY